MPAVEDRGSSNEQQPVMEKRRTVVNILFHTLLKARIVGGGSSGSRTSKTIYTSNMQLAEKACLITLTSSANLPYATRRLLRAVELDNRARVAEMAISISTSSKINGARGGGRTGRGGALEGDGGTSGGGVSSKINSWERKARSLSPAQRGAPAADNAEMAEMQAQMAVLADATNVVSQPWEPLAIPAGSKTGGRFSTRRLCVG